MALSIGQLASFTQNYIVPKAVENVFSSNPLLYRLREKGIKYTGGLEYRIPLAHAATSSAGAFSGYDLLATAANDQFTSAAIQLRQHYATVTVSGREELLNSGKEAILDLMEMKRQMAEMTIEDNLGTGLQGDNSATGKDIDGLAAILSTSSTYAGIATADMSAWKAKVPSLAVAGTLTKLEIQKLIGQATIGADKPTVLVTRQSVFDKIWALWEGQQRFEDGAMADAGFQSMRINGIPLVVDSHVTGTDGGNQDNWLEALNERYLFLLTHKDCNFKVVPIPPQKDQDVKMVRILWAGNLACSSRRMQAVLKTIDPAL
jgi:hypothetical protein